MISLSLVFKFKSRGCWKLRLKASLMSLFNLCTGDERKEMLKWESIIKSSAFVVRKNRM